MGVALYTSRLVLSTLGVENYGIYSVVGGVVVLFSFFNSSMSSATQRFLAIDFGRKIEGNLQYTFNTALAIHLAIAVLVLIIAESVGLWFVNYRLNFPAERMTEVNIVYQFSVLSSIIGVTQVPFNALIIVRERMSIFAMISVAETFLRLIIVYILVRAPYSKLVSFSVLLFIVSLVISTFYKVYCLRSFKESKFMIVKEWALYGELLSYSGWNLIGNIATVGKGQGVNILLNVFFGTLLNAAYGIMIQAQTAVQSFVLNFQIAVNPQIYKLYAENKLSQMHGLMFRSSKFSYFLLFILICPIVYNIDYLLVFWLKNPPEFSNVFIKYALINLLIECVSGALITGALSTGKIKWYQIVVGSILLLNLPISYIAFKFTNNPVAFLYVSIFIAFLTLIFRLLFLRKMIKLNVKDYVCSVLIPILLVSVFTGLFMVGYFAFFGKADSIVMLFITSCVIMSFGMFVIILVGCNHGERLVLLRSVEVIKNKFKSR
ncbi:MULTISPECIES: lipopolysaccharide biosynthesis protein [Sphingobacterium]|uniref:Lipopolysaccharide biosynthesis protein n=1 Tax=Sphingobacterium populi TaxID=1812824 RepID=A0ABW5UB11_9SPHI|nr:lipopolysaccharide biosynthesis protein [Sphingobacterium sp. CFCC 11742]